MFKFETPGEQIVRRTKRFTETQLTEQVQL